MGEENWIVGAVEALAGGAVSPLKPVAPAPRRKTGRAVRNVPPKELVPSQQIERATSSPEPNRTAPVHPHSAEPLPLRKPSRKSSAEPLSPAPEMHRKPEKARAGDTESALPPDGRRPGPLRSADTNSPAPEIQRKPAKRRAGETELAGHKRVETHIPCASQTLSGGQIASVAQLSGAPQPASGGGQSLNVAHHDLAAAGQPLALIVEEWRRCQDLLRARQRLVLQSMAICRRLSDGDKEKGAKLYTEVLKNPNHPVRAMWLTPFLMSIDIINGFRAESVKRLEKLSRTLPVYPWAKEVKGLGDYQLAAIIGECAGAGCIGPGDYRTVSALWKRMGLAVIKGERQRRVPGADALDHGYNAERRSLMWNVGGSLMKAQIRSEKDEKGKKVEGSEYAIGDYGQVYLDRKAYLREREEAKPEDERWTKARIHNDAKRYMEKRLLRHLWQEWRRATFLSETIDGSPAAEIPEAA